MKKKSGTLNTQEDQIWAKQKIKKLILSIEWLGKSTLTKIQM